VDYIGLIGPVIKSLQQLNSDKDKEIGVLRDEVRSLDARLKALEDKLGAKLPEANNNEDIN
jgi:chaperonin cofactor prefoldin